MPPKLPLYGSESTCLSEAAVAHALHALGHCREADECGRAEAPATGCLPRRGRVAQAINFWFVQGARDRFWTNTVLGLVVVLMAS